MSVKTPSLLSLEKTAQAWCTPTTENTPMNPALAVAFANILDEVWSKPWLGNATTLEMLEEVICRIKLQGMANYKTTNPDAAIREVPKL